MSEIMELHPSERVLILEKQMLQRMKCFLVLLSMLVVISGSSLYAEIEIYFAPNGGFHPENNQRTIMLGGKKVAATLNNALLELIESTEAGGTIKIAMYAFGYRPIQDALIKAAKERNIKVKLELDAIAAWTQEIRTEFKNRIIAEHQLAKKEGRVFNFQLKEIYSQAMVDRGRFKKIKDGEIIYGTMHEKFGLFYPKGCRIPLHGFCGSANISWSAGQVFGENRVIFKNEPTMGRQLAEEFARLWNEFGTAVTDNCESESYFPATPRLGDVQIVSNSKPIDEEHLVRLDEILMNMMEKVWRKSGTLDVAMFSFTHAGLANKLLELAERYPQIKVRILMDQTQLMDDDNHQGVLGPYMERVAQFKNLKNFEIRYKWRSNTYAWDPETDSCQLIHWRNLLLHHKCLVVNRHRMGLGSYNWSASGEFRNFENIMCFIADVPEHQKIIARFMKEYDIIWNSLKKEGPIQEKLANPQVVTGPQGRALKKVIFSTFADSQCRKLMGILDTNPNGCPEKLLAKITELASAQLQEKLEKLEKATLIFRKKQDNETIYLLAD